MDKKNKLFGIFLKTHIEQFATLVHFSQHFFFFFYQNDLHILLTKQFYKINYEIKKNNREEAYNKKVTKQHLLDVKAMVEI